MSTYSGHFSQNIYIIDAGGSCGYGESVSQAPFSSMVTGIGPSLYNSGKECGACYEVLNKYKYGVHYLCSARGHENIWSCS